MKKKLLSLMVALLAITAFAATMSVTMTKRAPVTELTVISEATTWDFSKLTANTSSEYYASEGIKLTDASTPTKNDEFIYANYLTTFFTADASFKADAIAFKGEYPIRKNQYAQNGTLHFKTSVAGKIVVSFNDTGSSASATAVKRYLIVNGTQTEYWTSRENNGDTPYEANLKVTSGEIAVPAGDVTITGSSAIQVSKIVFTPDGDTPSTPTAIVYDFAAAAAAGENPANLNGGSANGAVFYGWESESKTYSKRQDYKGYTWAEGSVLPTECHVWRRSDRINGNMTAADAEVKGLNCPNQREMAINGLKAGQKVVIEYTGEGQMLYATGYDPANATAEPNTVAIVGDGNKAAISGTTAIPSGTPIHIVSTDNGYFVFRVLKNMVITKITISEETPIDPATVVKPNKVTLGTAEGGTIKVSQAQAFEGDKIYATFTPAEGYSSSDIVAIIKNDADEDVTSSITFGEDETGSYLIMPAFNITVSVVFQPLPKFYIIGDMNNWDRTAMTEMTRNEETGRYEYEYAPTTTAYFAFADKQFTEEEAAADPNWDTFNTTRYSLGEGNVDATLGEIKSLVKGVNGTIVLQPGTYKIVVEPDFNAVTITGEVTPPTPVTVDKLYIMGTGTPKGWVGTTELTFNETAQAFEYEATVTTEDTYLTFGDAEFTSWDDFNGKHRYAPGEGNTEAVLDAEVQLVLVNDGNVLLKTPGTYKISVTKDLKMTITTGGTGINGIYVDGEAADIFSDGKPVYNLSGQRVFKGYKGIVIKNGKKVVIK